MKAGRLLMSLFLVALPAMGWAAGETAPRDGNRTTANLLTKADGTTDRWESDDVGAAKVAVISLGASTLAVFGDGTVGIAPTKAPVFVGGVDNAGLLKGLRMDGSGVINLGADKTIAVDQDNVVAAVKVPGEQFRPLWTMPGLFDGLKIQFWPGDELTGGFVNVKASVLATGATTEVTLAAILAKIISAPATEATLALLEGKDFATQTTLAAVLAKIIAAPATEAKQDTGNTSLASIDGKDFATQTTLAAILAKIISAPATEATLALLEGKDFATQTTLAAVLAKIIAAPATEAKQDTGNTSLASIDGKDFATQTTLAAILAKIIAAPSTEAKQDDNITQVTATELNTDSATAFGSTTVTVGTTAILILAADVNRRSALIRNADSNTVLFTGPTSGVTTANGMPIAVSGVPGATGNGGTIIYSHTRDVWAIVNAGTADIRIQTESD